MTRRKCRTVAGVLIALPLLQAAGCTPEFLQAAFIESIAVQVSSDAFLAVETILMNLLAV